MKSFRIVPVSLATLVLAGILAGCGNDTATPTGLSPSLDSTPPSAPSTLTVDDMNGVVTLQWDASAAPDIAGYQVFIYGPSPDRDNSYIQIAEVPSDANSYTLPGVSGEALQFYRVRAIDDAGNRSGLSAALEVSRVPVDPPTGTVIPGTSERPREE